MPAPIIGAEIGNQEIGMPHIDPSDSFDGAVPTVSGNAVIWGSLFEARDRRRVQAAVLPDNTNPRFLAPTEEADIKVYTFTAREAMTLQHLIFSDDVMLGSYHALGASQLAVTRIEVIGGPNNGLQVVRGSGVNAQVFTRVNIGRVPSLDIDLAPGNVVEIEVAGSGDLPIITPISLDAVFIPGAMGLTPVTILTREGGYDPSGGLPSHLVDLSSQSAAPAVGGFLVNSVPDPGAEVRIPLVRQGFFGFLTGDGGVSTTAIFVAVAGARTPGSSEFSVASGTVGGVRDSLLAAMLDSGNVDFAQLWTASSTGPATVTLTVADTEEFGPVYNGTLFQGTDDDAISPISPAGGARTRVQASFENPAAESEIKQLVLLHYYPAVDDFYEAAITADPAIVFHIEAGPLQIDAVPVAMGPIQSQPKIGVAAVASAPEGAPLLIDDNSVLTVSLYSATRNYASVALFVKTV